MRIRKNISITLTLLLAFMMLLPTVTAAKTEDNTDIASLGNIANAETNDIDTSDLRSVYMLGDANSDSKVDIRDATEIQKQVANIITLSPEGMAAADTNTDGTVNIIDSTDIQKYLADFTVSGSIGEEKEYLSSPDENIVTTEPTATAAEETTAEADNPYDSLNDLQGWISVANDYFAPGNEYTAETRTALQREINNAEALCDSEYVTNSEITAQIEALKKAIEGLIPVSQDCTDKEISFNLLEEFRINGYGSDKTELYLITSKAEMEAVIAKVEGSEYGSIYTTPTVSEKFTDDYFEQKALIISMNVVGGSNCTQSIDSISVKGSILTVHRSLYKPEIVLCDMNYRYVLIELNADDIRSVRSLADDTTTITV